MVQFELTSEQHLKTWRTGPLRAKCIPDKQLRLSTHTDEAPCRCLLHCTRANAMPTRWNPGHHAGAMGREGDGWGEGWGGGSIPDSVFPPPGWVAG